MSEGVETHEECLAAAEKLGRVVVYPAANELLIDIDSEAQRAIFGRAVEILGRAETVRWRGMPSPSGQPGHIHITVTLMRAVTPRERILLQACLGSDPLRELLSLQRLDAGNPHPTLFFELPPPPPTIHPDDEIQF